MAHAYSNKTLAALARFIDHKFTNPEMSVLFFSVSVPQGFDFGSSKLQRAFNVVTKLAAVEEFAEILDELIQEVIAQKYYVFEYPEEIAQPLCRALKADGLEVREGRIVLVDSLETELVQESNILYERLQVLGMPDVHNNLEQAHENFIDGNWESCNAMLRTALEATLQHIAQRIAGSEDAIPRRNPNFLTPADIRRYLADNGFNNEDEKAYTDALYGFVSPRGSHPGMSDEAESRLRRLIAVAWIQYSLEKLLRHSAN